MSIVRVIRSFMTLRKEHKMPSRKAAPQKEPTIPPNRAIRALTGQVESLQKLKLRRYDEAESDEREWQHTTQGIVEVAFGNPSTALTNFRMATAAGVHNLMGISPQQCQINFEMRIKEHEALLRSLISTLQLQLPKEEIAEHQRRFSHGTSASRKAALGTKIFIGHGRSGVWMDLRDFLERRLKLDCTEFSSESAAGVSTKERLEEMLDQSSFAFLVMTAEDERLDGTRHARENVIHECGLFQGRLGFKRAIVLLEQGCAQFSNIGGLTHIPFPTGNITAACEEIRRVLEREGLLENG
jgi:predicted nucleotide-binding protein